MNYGKAKVLFLDLETAQNIVAVWSCGYKMSVGPESIIKERFIISAQWAWNNEKTVHGVLSNIKKADDKQLIKKLTKIISKADVIVGHNIAKFDSRWMEGRAMINKLPPTGLPFKTMYDTMRLAKRAFGLNSYKLDYLAKLLDIPGKIKTSYDDWMRILVDKDMKAAEGMLKYGKHDITINRMVFEALLPYVKLPGKLNALIQGRETEECECETGTLQKWGIRTTSKGKRYQKFRCSGCGSCHQSQILLGV